MNESEYVRALMQELRELGEKRQRDREQFQTVKISRGSDAANGATLKQLSRNDNNAFPEPQPKRNLKGALSYEKPI